MFVTVLVNCLPSVVNYSSGFSYRLAEPPLPDDELVNREHVRAESAIVRLPQCVPFGTHQAHTTPAYPKFSIEATGVHRCDHGCGQARAGRISAWPRLGIRIPVDSIRYLYAMPTLS